MRIAIDGYELNSGFTGVGRFLFNLVQALLKIDHKNSYTIFLKEKFDLLDLPENIEVVILDSDKTHTKWENSDLRKALNKRDFDLFFSPNHSVPFLYRGRSVMTIHDVSWKGVPGDFSLKEKFTRDLKTKLSIKKCPLIFTISEFSKTEIIKYYSVIPKKIIPVHHGIEEKFRESQDSEVVKFREKYKLGDSRVIGFLGNMFKRRNIENLITSFNLLKKDMDIKLLLAGENHYRDGLDGLNDEGVIYIPRLPEEEINTFYSSLSLFIYLSEYEGFGFPPLEALSCGTTSLLLDSSSLTEIYKDMAWFVKDAEPGDLSNNIGSILADGKDQNNIILNNFRKKKEYFSWERAAGDFLGYFNTINELEKI